MGNTETKNAEVKATKTKNTDTKAVKDSNKDVVTSDEINKKYLNEKINFTIMRPLGVSIEETDVTVTVNGINYQLQYDKTVKIPRFVAEVLRNSYNESRKNAENIQKLTSESTQIAEF